MFTWELTHTMSARVIEKSLAGWQHKIIFSPILVAYHQFLGGDEKILFFFFILFFADMFLGFISAAKRGVFSFHRAGAWIVKATVYGLCIIITGFINDAISISLDLRAPFLDIIMALLVMTEAVSILVKLQDLTGMVPPVILTFVRKAQRNANRRLEDMLDDKTPEGEEKDNG